MKDVPAILLLSFLPLLTFSIGMVGVFKPDTYTISFSEPDKIHERYPELLAYDCVMTNEKLTSSKKENGEWVTRERTLYVCRDRTLWR